MSSDHNEMELGTNNRKIWDIHKSEKINTLLNNQPVKEKSKKSEYTLKCLKVKTEHTKIWHATKAVSRGKFTAVNTHIMKEKRFQINDLAF